MHDSDAGRHHRKGLECLLAPLEKLVAFPVADELDRHVAVKRRLRSREVHLHRVVHHQVHRHQGLNLFRGHPLGGSGIPHRGEIHQQRHPREILENNSGHREGDLVIAGRPGVPVGEIADILFGHLATVHIAQDRFHNHPDADRQAGKIGGHPGLGQGRQGIESAFGAGSGLESADHIEAHLFISGLTDSTGFSFRRNRVQPEARRVCRPREAQESRPT